MVIDYPMYCRLRDFSFAFAILATENLAKLDIKLLMENHLQRTRALKALTKFVSEDDELSYICRKYGFDSNVIEEKFSLLSAAGLGQIVGPFHLTAASLVWPVTLDYILKNGDESISSTISHIKTTLLNAERQTISNINHSVSVEELIARLVQERTGNSGRRVSDNLVSDGMLPLSYVDLEYKSDLPPFDKRYKLKCNSPDSEDVYVDIWELDNKIEKCGFQVKYNKGFVFGKCSKYYRKSLKLLEGIFGQGREIILERSSNYRSGVFMIYGDQDNNCVVQHLILKDQELLVFKYGNRNYFV